MGNVRSAALALLIATFFALTRTANAGESIRLVVTAPPSCAVESDVVSEIETLGGRPRDAADDERARTFAVTIAPSSDGYTAHLVITDLLGQTSERVVSHPACPGAAKSAALLIALALDEDVTTITPTPATPPFWPAPADAPRTDLPRRGSGGVVVSGLMGGSPLPQLGMNVVGVRAYAAARVSRGMRLGAALAFTSETDRLFTDDHAQWRSNGWAGRAGAVIGWGAPWNDSVVGFVGEAGVAVGRQTGESARADRNVAIAPCTLAGLCFDEAHAVAKSIVFVSPYAATSLVLQVPWRAPVRPIAAFTSTLRAGGAEAVMADLSAELGVVWQAW